MTTLLRNVLLVSLRIYQSTVSPVLHFAGVRCRYYPSCSCYARGAFEKYALPTAAFKTLGRVARCNPMSRGGVDLP